MPSGKVRGKAKPAPGDRTRTVNLAGSLTATLIDPLPVDGRGEELPPAQRRQIGDGAVLVDAAAQPIGDSATQQARRNEERQALRQTATTDGAVLVGPDGPRGADVDGAELGQAGR